jgi:hypothetical protein
MAITFKGRFGGDSWRPVTQSDLACRLNVYFSHVFAFLSNWFIVGFGIERALVVRSPLSARSVGSHRYKLHYVRVLLVLALVLYSVLIVGSGVEWVQTSQVNSTNRNESEGAFLCVTVAAWFTTIERVVFVDILVSILVPFVLILLSNVFISAKLLHASHSIRKSLNSRSRRAAGKLWVHDRAGVGVLLRRRRSYKKTTSVLLMISTAFLVLNTPLVISKLRYLYVNSMSDVHEEQKYSSTVSEQIVEHVTCDLFYLNFAINFILYSPNRTEWRRLFTRQRMSNTF